MRLSSGGASDIMSSEGLRLDVYRDSAGIPTVGWGHMDKSMAVGSTITKEQAVAFFQKDIANTERGVQSLVKTQLDQNQYDAVISLAFNIGVGKFAKSTMLQMLNSGDMAGAAAEFAKWRKAGGKIDEGLVARRAKETALFLGKREPGAPAPQSTIVASTQSTVLPPKPQAITQNTTTNQGDMTNQEIAARLTSLVTDLKQGAANDTENEEFLSNVQREGKGLV